MNLFKRLFKIEEKAPKANKRISHLILANEVFSHGWNDPSEIKASKTSIILDTVSDNESLNEKLNYWNKHYYDFLTHHYSVSEEQLEEIASIINVSPDKHRELYAFWPKELEDKTYEDIYKKLKLKFVQAVPISENIKNNYAIVLNERFWDIPTHNSNVLVDIINTYERSFDSFELIHPNEEDAMKFGLIIYDRLCIERPPQTDYYYHERINQQLNRSIEIPTFNFNTNFSNPDDKKAEYERIINNHANELEEMEAILLEIKEKPFKIERM